MIRDACRIRVSEGQVGRKAAGRPGAGAGNSLNQQPFSGSRFKGTHWKQEAFQSRIKQMALATHPITSAERARRTRVYEEARASVRLEGFELDEQVEALYQRYMSGELTLAEVGSAIDELDDREFGPVSLSRHKRP